MKVLFLFLVFIPVCAVAQPKDTMAFNKANRIAVVTQKTAAENFALLQAVFAQNGYVIRSRNLDSLTLHTRERPDQARTLSYGLSGQAKEGEIELSGWYSTRVEASISGASYKVFVYDITYKGKKGAPCRQIFGAMNAVAQEIARQAKGQVYYWVQNNKKKALFQ